MCTKCHLEDKYVKFLKNCGTFAIKESEDGESIIMEV